MIRRLYALSTYSHHSIDELKKLQWKRLKNILNYADNSVPYYKKLFKAHSIIPNEIKSYSDFLRIPVTTKKHLQEYGDQFISKGFKKKSLIGATSSGSTARPTTTYFSRSDIIVLKLLLKLRSKRYCGLKISDRILLIYGQSQGKVDNHNKSLLNQLLGKQAVSLNDSLPEHIKVLQHFKPTVLYGQPSYFNELSEYVKDNNISIPPIRLIFTSSETTDADQQQKVSETFNAPVFDIYGSTEFKEVGWQCKKNEGYHLNIDCFYIECLQQNKPGVVGQEGDLVVTSLFNQAMPLIRYQQGDRAAMKNEPCSCGNPLPMMTSVKGRLVDYFTLANGRRIAPLTVTNAIRSFAIPNVKQYQIEQRDVNDVLIKFVPTDYYTSSQDSIVINDFKILMGKHANITLQKVKKIDREPNGKFKVVKSSIKA